MARVRSLIFALLLFSHTLSIPRPVVAQHAAKDDEARAVFNELFPPGPFLRAQEREPHRPCLTVRMMQMHAFLESNEVSPHLRQEILDVIAPEGIKPAFARTLETKHFTVRFTDADATASNNVNAASIEPFLKDLDAYYDRYLRAFRAIDPPPPVKMFLDVYDFQLDPRFGEAWAFTSPDSVSVNVVPSVFAAPCLARSVLAHELFHRVEMAHGLREHISEIYWVEGMAEWATVFVNPRDNLFVDYIADVFRNPWRALANRSYDGALFWIYLDERYQELNGRRAGGKVIDLFLKRVAKLGPDVPSQRALPAIMGNLVKDEQRKSRQTLPKGLSPYASLAQDWHVANLNLALGVRNKKLGYDAYPRVDECGAERNIVPLVAQGSGRIESNDHFLTGGDSALALGAHYYALQIGPAVNRLNVEVKAFQQSPVAVSIAGLKGTTPRFLKTGVDKGEGKGFKETLKFKKGSVDSVYVIVAGYDIDKFFSPFTININRGTIDLTGSWNFTGVENAMEVVETGSGFYGTYRGVGAHSALEGQLVGQVENGVWKGTFTVVENNVFGEGTFELQYSPGPPEMLVGTITAHNNFDPVDRTTPISFTKK